MWGGVARCVPKYPSYLIGVADRVGDIWVWSFFGDGQRGMSGCGQRGMSGCGQRGRPPRTDSGKRGVSSMSDNDQSESPSVSGDGQRGVPVEKVFEVIVGDLLVRDVYSQRVC